MAAAAAVGALGGTQPQPTGWRQDAGRATTAPGTQFPALGQRPGMVPTLPSAPIQQRPPAPVVQGRATVHREAPPEDQGK